MQSTQRRQVRLAQKFFNLTAIEWFGLRAQALVKFLKCFLNTLYSYAFF